VKLRAIIRKIKSTNPLYLYVEKLKKQKEIRVNLKLDFKVRWSTTYQMLSRVLVYKNIINEITNNSDSMNNLSVLKHRNINELN
jgi:hypothetical protein